MINFLQILFVICFALLIVGFFVGNFYFLKIFNKLKNEEPAYLESKLKKYSYFDARTQFSMIVFKGQYEDLKNIEIKKQLNKQRWIMVIHFVITIICIASFVLQIFLKHYGH